MGMVTGNGDGEERGEGDDMEKKGVIGTSSFSS